MGQIDEAVWAKAVADTIRAERGAARLSQQELAHRADIPRQTYIRYETGERQPNLVQVAQIAGGLRMPLSTFIARVADRAGGPLV
jgi:transcriptional regulator with XRE-family HTH domain